MRRAVPILSAILAVTTAAAGAATLDVGDPAPPLSVSKWVKGGPVDLAAGKEKSIFVVEFWATWCGPCVRTIPHLSEMAERFGKAGVVVVGISIDGEGTRGNVEGFVGKMGKKMEYPVAIDDGTKSNEAWLDAAGVDGIPHAFIVGKDGKIAWHGHPMDGLDLKLAELAGDKEYAEGARKTKDLREGLNKAFEEEDWAKALEALDGLLALRSSDAELLFIKYRVLLMKKDPAAGKWGREALSRVDDGEMLNGMAWGILTDDEFEGSRDLPLALEAAKKANELTGGKNWSVLDTYARALFDTGSRQQAVEMQKKSIAIAKAEKADEDAIDTLQEALARFEKGGKDDAPAAPAAREWEAPPVEPGFVSLFDGKEISRHFLVKGKAESWKAAGGVIRSTPGGDRLMSRERFGDFILRLEWRISAGGSSGIFLRVPSQDDGAPWETGYGVQISGEGPPRDDARCTGSLYGVEAAKPRPDETPGIWHAFEIRCLGKRVTVKCDGAVCVDATAEKSEAMAKRPREGFIGLQDSRSDDPESFVEYRNIRIARLGPDGTAPGFTALAADGKGWHPLVTGHGSAGGWKYADGAWTGEQDPPGSGNGGVLAADGSYGDFEFILEVKPDWACDSGIFLRSTPEGKAYQVLVDHIEGSSIGGIYGEGIGGFAQTFFKFLPDRSIEAPAEGPAPIAAADWRKWWDLDGFNEIRGRIVGNPPAIDVWLNGKHVTYFHDETRRLGDKGLFAIQVHGGDRWAKDGKIRYRGIQLRELPR